MQVARSRQESLDVLRFRVIRETEAALLYGLEHPEATTRIPVVEVGKGAFAPAVADRFWAHVLGSQQVARP